MGRMMGRMMARIKPQKGVGPGPGPVSWYHWLAKGRPGVIFVYGYIYIYTYIYIYIYIGNMQAKCTA